MHYRVSGAEKLQAPFDPVFVSVLDYGEVIYGTYIG